MTVESQTVKVVGAGNGVATVFSFSPMVIFDSTQLQVYHVASGVETLLTEGSGASNYSVTVSTYPGTGSITYPADTVTPLPSGETLLIKRLLPLTQLTDLENQGGYFANTQERTFDRGIMVSLQQQEEIDRTIKAPISDTVVSLELPITTDRANKALVFGASGEVSVDTPGAGLIGALAAIDEQTDNYTLVIGDKGKAIKMNKGTAVNLTVPPNSSVAFPVGSVVHVINYGAGLVTVVAGSGVTVRTPLTLVLRAQYSVATLLKIDTNEWVIKGDLTA